MSAIGLLLTLAGCPEPGPAIDARVTPPDVAVGADADLSMGSDLAAAEGDLAGPPRDLAGPKPDMAGPPRDMAGPPRDMAGPPRDMAGPPRDMAGPANLVVSNPTQPVAGGCGFRAADILATPGGYLCYTYGGPLCAATYTSGTSVVVEAQLCAGASVVGWTGPCTPSGTKCTAVLPSGTTTLTPQIQINHSLTIQKLNPPGWINVNPYGPAFRCNSGFDTMKPSICTANTCCESFSAGTSVALDTGGVLVRWGGACSGVSSKCTVTITGQVTVTADFVP